MAWTETELGNVRAAGEEPTGDTMDCAKCGSVPQTWSGLCPGCGDECE